MADKQVKAEQATIDVMQRAKGFWASNSKMIMIVGSIVILLVGGYLGYKYLYKLPNEKKANDLIFPAEKLFGVMTGTSSYNKDTVNIVLNGDKANGITGLLKIASSYSGTKSGNRAEYMIGACYLHIKQFDKAITYLKKFDGNGADQIQSKAYLLLGYAYSEQKKTDDALDYFTKAGHISGLDEAMASEALFIAGRYANTTGKTKDAIELFQELKDKYPATQRVGSGEVDKYLASLGVIK